MRQIMKVVHLEETSSDLRKELEYHISKWGLEIEQILGTNAIPSSIVFNNHFLIPETGAGGFADTGKILVLAFDLHFKDKDTQIKSLRGSFFHESFHIAQNWLGDDVLPALEEAILEGAATVFEREETGSNPLWGQYDKIENMKEVIQEVRKLPTDYDEQKWKYYDRESDQQWILYKVGTFIVDTALRSQPHLTIRDLSTKSYTEILNYANL